MNLSIFIIISLISMFSLFIGTLSTNRRFKFIFLVIGGLVLFVLGVIVLSIGINIPTGWWLS